MVLVVQVTSNNSDGALGGRNLMGEDCCLRDDHYDSKYAIKHTHKLLDPVSNTTLKFWAGVPMVMGP